MTKKNNINYLDSDDEIISNEYIYTNNIDINTNLNDFIIDENLKVKLKKKK